MPFDVEAAMPPDKRAIDETPCHLALIVGGFRGIFDVTVHGEGTRAADSFDLYLPDPADAVGLNTSVNFYGDGEPDGEGRMIVFVGIHPEFRGSDTGR